MGVTLFKDADPYSWGSIWMAFFTLFQVRSNGDSNTMKRSDTKRTGTIRHMPQGPTRVRSMHSVLAVALTKVVPATLEEVHPMHIQLQDKLHTVDAQEHSINTGHIPSCREKDSGDTH